MKQLFLLAALAALTLLPLASARAQQGEYPYQGQTNFTIDGTIRQVETGRSRLWIRGNDGARYLVDTSDGDIVLPSGSTSGTLDDLSEGQSVHVIGTLLEDNLIEADRVRVYVPDPEPQPVSFTDAHADYEHIDLPDNSDPAPADPAPAAAPAPASSSTFSVDGMVREVDAGNDHITIVDANDDRYAVDTLGADIILPASSAAGHCSDLARGMHVHLIGSQLPNGVVVADRVSVQSDADLALSHQAALVPGGPPASDPAAAPSAPLAPVTTVIAAPDPAPVQQSQVNEPLNYTPADFPDEDMDSYTGILIDCRDLEDISRSPAPTICGPDMELLYPDRSHVPTPDEVQEESIVRYYRTIEDAETGVGGPHPLVLRAVEVIGPAQDGVQLSQQDMGLFLALDKKLHYTQNWKVGFLVPPDK